MARRAVSAGVTESYALAGAVPLLARRGSIDETFRIA